MALVLQDEDVGLSVAAVPSTTRIEILFLIGKMHVSFIGTSSPPLCCQVSEGCKTWKTPRPTKMTLVAKEGQIVDEHKSVECIGTYYLCLLY